MNIEFSKTKVWYKESTNFQHKRICNHLNNTTAQQLKWNIPILATWISKKSVTFLGHSRKLLASDESIAFHWECRPVELNTLELQIYFMC